MNRRTFLHSTLALTGAALAAPGPAHPQSAQPVAFTPRLDLYGRHLLWLRDPAEVAAAVREAELASPSIVVIGEVVNQRVASCAPEPAAVEMPIPLKQG